MSSNTFPFHQRSGSPLRYPGTEVSSAASYGRRLLFAVVLMMLIALSSTGCSLMIRKAGEALVSGNSIYATDDDPELVWEALPFGLKTIEGLLVEAPKSKKL